MPILWIYIRSSLFSLFLSPPGPSRITHPAARVSQSTLTVNRVIRANLNSTCTIQLYAGEYVLWEIVSEFPTRLYAKLIKWPHALKWRLTSCPETVNILLAPFIFSTCPRSSRTSSKGCEVRRFNRTRHWQVRFVVCNKFLYNSQNSSSC